MTNEFIKIGERRIKRSNIKSFGIAHEQVKGDVTLEAQSLGEAMKSLAGGIIGVIEGIGFVAGVKSFTSISQPTKRYVYVTTYQNDNYKFYEDQYNIDEVIGMLEQS